MKTVALEEAKLMSYHELCEYLPANDPEFLKWRSKANAAYKRITKQDLFDTYHYPKPNVYDLVYIANHTKILFIELQKLAKNLGIEIEESKNLHSRIFITIESLWKANIKHGTFKGEKQ